MALEDNGAMNSMVMPVAPMYGGGYGANGGMFGGDGWAWIILLLLLVGNGGWGNGCGNNGGVTGGLYPWMNQTDVVNNGFRDQALGTTLAGIQTGVQGIATQLCNGFSGVNATVNNGFANAEASANARQMADMQQNFANQAAMTQCFNMLTAQSAQNTRDIIDATRNGDQAIMDKLCALELDGYKAQLAQAQRDNIGLQNQLNMSAWRESQTAQNALIQQEFTNEIDALYNRLKNCPVGTIPVYGSQPVFTCNNNGFNCGCNS